MTDGRTSKLIVCVAAVASLAVAGPAAAQMTPIADQRETFAKVTFLGDTQTQADSPPAPFAYFYSLLDVLVEDPDPNGAGSCSADAFQISQFYPAGISMSGGTAGSWNVVEGAYQAWSIANLKFHLDTCVEYQLDAWLDYGDFPDPGAGEIRLSGAGSASAYHQLVDTGEIHTTGRLAAGDYVLEGRSSFAVGSLIESVAGPTYSVIWTVTPCAASLIAVQPADLDVPCGDTAVFSVTPDPGAGSPSYQWRHNLVPLTNSGHITGATTPTLSIDNACHADSGYYDVVLDNGTVIEPSRLARLGITSTTGVEGARAGPQGAFTLFAAGPNPFSSSTTFRYVAPRAQRGTIAIYDIGGARVRTLTDGLLAGAGSVSWDGRTASGARAPAGIYFLRADAEGTHESRRLVLLK